METEEWPDSGPYCKHWSDFECSEVCANCGHSCAAHSGGFDACQECDCKEFVDRKGGGA